MLKCVAESIAVGDLGVQLNITGKSSESHTTPVQLFHTQYFVEVNLPNTGSKANVPQMSSKATCSYSICPHYRYNEIENIDCSFIVTKKLEKQLSDKDWPPGLKHPVCVLGAAFPGKCNDPR